VSVTVAAASDHKIIVHIGVTIAVIFFDNWIGVLIGRQGTASATASSHNIFI